MSNSTQLVEELVAQVCLSEATIALDCDHFDWRYKLKRIRQEKADYLAAFENVKERIDWEVVDQFNEMIAQLPRGD